MAEAAISDPETTGPATEGCDATGVFSKAFPRGNKSTKRQELESTAASSENAQPQAPATKRATDLATPATTTDSMDSDDEFMSDISSQDGFMDNRGSEDESLGEGVFFLVVLCH